MPPWLSRPLPPPGVSREVSRYLKGRGIETVCMNSRCPNMCECYSTGNVSFLILGNVCTRKCAFCAVQKGAPEQVNALEARSIADAVRKLGLRYVVVTSVTRDDLTDGGANHYAEVVQAIKCAVPSVIVEVLTPDFNGSRYAVMSVIRSGADVFSHNMETIERLYPAIRPIASYRRSLKILAFAAGEAKIPVKSGFMVGLGEAEVEVLRLMTDIRKAGCDFLTIGQYLRPKGSLLEVAEYIRPNTFEMLKIKAFDLGFKNVASGPYVRSSYRAGEMIIRQEACV
ncbi:MAG: lipoyl synthase [Candidatus Omnitrophota bacterium]|nr:lipoyl synthase [Candidatus Omnitrophota bacterium]